MSGSFTKYAKCRQSKPLLSSVRLTLGWNQQLSAPSEGCRSSFTQPHKWLILAARPINESAEPNTLNYYDCTLIITTRTSERAKIQMPCRVGQRGGAFITPLVLWQLASQLATNNLEVAELNAADVFRRHKQLVSQHRSFRKASFNLEPESAGVWSQGRDSLICSLGHF